MSARFLMSAAGMSKPDSDQGAVRLGANKDVVLFHATARLFVDFRIPASGLHLGSLDQAVQAATLKLARLPAKEYAKLEPDTSGWHGRLIKVRLRCTRIERVKDCRTAAAWARRIADCKARGVEALVYLNEYEGRKAEDSYVVFDASSIEVLDRNFK